MRPLLRLRMNTYLPRRGERGDAAAAATAVGRRRRSSSSGSRRRRSSRVWWPAAARNRDSHQRWQRGVTTGRRQVAAGAWLPHSQVRRNAVVVVGLRDPAGRCLSAWQVGHQLLAHTDLPSPRILFPQLGAAAAAWGRRGHALQAAPRGRQPQACSQGAGESLVGGAARGACLLWLIERITCHGRLMRGMLAGMVVVSPSVTAV